MDNFAQVRIVLRASRERGISFDRAWYRALRQILPGDEADELERIEYDADRPILSETKPHYKAAFEGRALTTTERREARRLADKRTADLRESELSQAA